MAQATRIGRLLRQPEAGVAAWLALVLPLVGAAGLAELLRFLAELRSPTLSDWLTNTVGALVGWAPAQLWLRAPGRDRHLSPCPR